MPRFQKGQSGNPKGRPRGILDIRMAWRSQFEPDAPTIIQKAIDMAKAGDKEMMRLCLDRMVPPAKARGEPVNLPSLEGTLSQQGGAVLQALADGELTPDEASTIMQTIAAQARIIEVDQLERRITELEQQNAMTDSK